MTIPALIATVWISSIAGFAVGINLRGNPQKRTRKTRPKSTPENGQSESK